MAYKSPYAFYAAKGSTTIDQKDEKGTRSPVIEMHWYFA